MQVISEFECPVCGKYFIRPTAEWAYKITINKVPRYVCSYHCTKGKEGLKKHKELWDKKEN